MPERGAAAARVGISGSYGGMNLGDEAILESIVTQLRAALDVEITVFTRDAADTLRRHRVEHAVPRHDLTREEAHREIERLDLLLLGGGGILFDADADEYLREVSLAHEARVPVMVYAVSAGPLADAHVAERVRAGLAEAAVVTVRDRDGKRVLEDLGLAREIIVTADPAVLLEPEPVAPERLRLEGVDPGRRLVGFSVREPGPAAPHIDVEHYHALLAHAADFVIDRFDADVVFVPLEREHQDLQHSHAVAARMQRPERAAVLKGEYSPGELLGLMRHLVFAVGMRLHFLIFAAAQGVPFVPLPYASKVTGFLESMGLDAPPLERAGTGSVLAAIDRSWDHRHALKRRMAKAMPELKRQARRTNELAVELLAGRAGSAEPAPRPQRG